MEFDRILGIIRETPLRRLCASGESQIFVKLERENPSGSVKDRAAAYILHGAYIRGEIREGDTVIEATSGNMGISLSMLGGMLGLRVRIVMPEGVSPERIRFIKGYGAEVILTPRAYGMSGAIAGAEKLACEGGGYLPRQFENTDGVSAHYMTTAPEIERALGGIPDVFIAGVGTGATLMGVGKYFKERGRCKVIAVEPFESAVLSGNEAAAHGIEGIGAGFIPPLLDRSHVDRVIAVRTDEAVLMARELAERFGLRVGVSSGAAFAAARAVVGGGKRIVALLPDSSDRYSSLS